MSGNRRKRAEKKTPSKRLNVVLREGSIQRLMLHVVMLKKNPGDLLSDLVDAHLRQFRVQENPATRATSQESVEFPEHASGSEQKAA